MSENKNVMSVDYHGAYNKVNKGDFRPKGDMNTSFNWITVLIMFLGLCVIIARFALGLGGEVNIGGLNLGPVTNLNQEFPWGLWISFDVLVGIAFAGGAYTLSFVVYALGRHRYHPIMRSVVLGGFLAYTFYAAALILDLGRPWNALNFVIHLWPSAESLWSPGSPSMGLVVLWFLVFCGFVILTVLYCRDCEVQTVEGYLCSLFHFHGGSCGCHLEDQPSLRDRLGPVHGCLALPDV